MKFIVFPSCPFTKRFQLGMLGFTLEIRQPSLEKDLYEWLSARVAFIQCFWGNPRGSPCLSYTRSIIHTVIFSMLTQQWACTEWIPFSPDRSIRATWHNKIWVCRCVTVSHSTFTYKYLLAIYKTTKQLQLALAFLSRLGRKYLICELDVVLEALLH